MPNKAHPWIDYTDEQLLQVRLKDLHVGLARTWLMPCIRDLQRELDERRLRIRPHFWISDEWFSPSNTPGIAVPFYLAHPRLMRLERKMIIDVEGGTVADCMRILRHEAGHVLQHSFHLHRRRRWQELFGHSTQKYPDFYRPNPASKRYVQHLRLWYAQSHPDEDFAETFAVWLSKPWRKRYADWPQALEKLEYVDELMGEIAGEAPSLTRVLEVDPIGRLKQTLGEHYKKKRAHYATEPSRAYDKDLLRLFASDAGQRGRPAAAFIRRYRRGLRSLVSRGTGEYQLTLDSVLDDMIARCRELKLRAVGSEKQLLAAFTVMLTAQVVHSVYNPQRRMWLAV